VLGRRAAILYLVTVAVASLATGLAVDGLIGAGALPSSALVPAASAMAVEGAHAHHDSAGSIFETASAVALLLVLVNALRPRRRPNEEAAAVDAYEEMVELRIKGMRCNGCVQSLQRALSEIPGVIKAEVRLEDGSARVRGRGFSEEAIAEAVESLGFSVEG